MSEESKSPLSKEAELLVRNIFHNRMIQLESKAGENIVFSKQMEIKKLQVKVETFIERNPNGIFEIRILEKNTTNKEHYKFAVVVKNFKHANLDKNATTFFIVIDNAFDSVDFYQLSINGVIMPI